VDGGYEMRAMRSKASSERRGATTPCESKREELNGALNCCKTQAFEIPAKKKPDNPLILTARGEAIFGRNHQYGPFSSGYWIRNRQGR